MDRSRNPVNRGVLLAAGLLLLAAGISVLAPQVPAADRLPAYWSDWAADRPWVEPRIRAAWHGGRGREAAAIAVLVLAALSAAALLLFQLRRRAVRRLPLPAPGTALDSGALTAAVTGRLLALPGVRAARTTLRGTAKDPCLRIRLVLDDTASPGRVLAELAGAVVPEARTVMDPQPLRAEVHFTAGRRRRRRVGGGAGSARAVR